MAVPELTDVLLIKSAAPSPEPSKWPGRAVDRGAPRDSLEQGLSKSHQRFTAVWLSQVPDL